MRCEYVTYRWVKNMESAADAAQAASRGAAQAGWLEAAVGRAILIRLRPSEGPLDG